MVERYSHQNGAHIQTAMDKLSERYKAKASWVFTWRGYTGITQNQPNKKAHY
jgi:hypothetical protein